MLRKYAGFVAGVLLISLASPMSFAQAQENTGPCPTAKTEGLSLIESLIPMADITALIRNQILNEPVKPRSKISLEAAEAGKKAEAIDQAMKAQQDAIDNKPAEGLTVELLGDGDSARLVIRDGEDYYLDTMAPNVSGKVMTDRMLIFEHNYNTTYLIQNLDNMTLGSINDINLLPTTGKTGFVASPLLGLNTFMRFEGVYFSDQYLDPSHPRVEERFSQHEEQVTGGVYLARQNTKKTVPFQLWIRGGASHTSTEGGTQGVIKPTAHINFESQF